MDDVRLYGKRLSSAEIAGSLNADNTTPPPKQSGVQAVTWTNQVNVAATGSLLAKTAGCNGCSDAGASSKTSLKGNGYLEFTATADTGLRVIGLATDASGTNASKINFAFRLQAGVVEIRELGVYRGEISYNPGDKLRISVQDGVVTYRKNDKVIHTSTKSAAAPLWADTTFFSMNSAIDQAMLASGDN